MPNLKLDIPSGGIGEVEYDYEEKAWYQSEGTKLNNDKGIPIFCLLSNLKGLSARYKRNLESSKNW